MPVMLASIPGTRPWKPQIREVSSFRSMCLFMVFQVVTVYLMTEAVGGNSLRKCGRRPIVERPPFSISQGVQVPVSRQAGASGKKPRRSGGPTTDSGKRTSSQNSLKHGLYSRGTTAIPRGLFQEDQAELDAFVDAVAAALAPRDELEIAQAYRIAGYYLQLRRLGRFEAEAMIVTMPQRTTMEIIAQSDLGLPEPTPEAERVSRALSLMEDVLERASRIDARIASSLNQALLIYTDLQRRPLPLALPGPEEPTAEP